MFAFIASEAREFSGFARNLKHVAPLEWGLDYARSAALHGQAIVLAANGPGPKLAARAAGVVKEYCELEGLVSIGFCGALDPQLQLGDIFVATSLVNVAHAPVVHTLSLPRSHSCERLGRLLSIDQVATSAEAKQSFYNQTHAAAIEMEAAGLAPLAAQWQIPFYAIKVVTDTASDSFPLDFNRLRTREGRFSRAKILAAIAFRPSALSPLLNLNRRCNQAAQILGDFLADARF